MATAHPGKPGPRHTGDLADIVDLMLATGARIGEILAIRWEDAELGTEHPTVTISGTIVYLKGRGLLPTGVDQERRRLSHHRPAPVRGGVLLARKPTAADNPHDAIFASRRGT